LSTILFNFEQRLCFQTFLFTSELLKQKDNKNVTFLLNLQHHCQTIIFKNVQFKMETILNFFKPITF